MNAATSKAAQEAATALMDVAEDGGTTGAIGDGIGDGETSGISAGIGVSGTTSMGVTVGGTDVIGSMTISEDGGIASTIGARASAMSAWGGMIISIGISIGISAGAWDDPAAFGLRTPEDAMMYLFPPQLMTVGMETLFIGPWTVACIEMRWDQHPAGDSHCVHAEQEMRYNQFGE